MFKWLKSKERLTVQEKIKRSLSEVEKEFIKAILILDREGVCLYSKVRDERIKDEEFPLLISLVERSKRAVEELIIPSKGLASLEFKLGNLRLFIVEGRDGYAIAVVDEGVKKVVVRKFEELLRKKLEELKEITS
ncbi:hypothetical protein [Thermovibrio sp.]